MLLLSLEWVSSEGFSFTIKNMSERVKKVLKVSNTLDTKRNHFSLATHLKNHLHQLGVSTILKAFCAAKESMG